jgi:hypothetical protein
VTEHTPEKVADLIAEARTALAEDRIAHWVVEGGMESVLDALEAVSAENESLRRFDWLKRSRGVEAERDEALAVIAEVRAMLPGPRTFAESLMRDFAGNLWPQTINADEVARILSRIPERPKED